MNEYKEFIREKMELLDDFRIAPRGSANAKALKKAFLSYGNEIKVDNICRDLIINGKSINEILEAM